MENYKEINMETWGRSSHWNYYRNILKAAICMTKRIDVTPVYKYCKKTGKKFSSVFLHTVCKTVNSLDCMRMLALENGNPAVWDKVHPNFTIFHEDDKTFSDLWIEYVPDLDEFIGIYEETMKIYGNRHGIKIRDNQPPNFFCISGVPWIDYDSVSTYSAGDRGPALFPILNYGKFEEIDGRMMMPFSINIAHASMDGYHIAVFFEELQKNLNSYKYEL